MKTITLTSNAKVNLALDVLGSAPTPAPDPTQRTSQRSSSAPYHFIQTVLYEITPQNTAGFKPDLVTIQVEEVTHAASNTSNADKHKILILCADPSVPTDKTNLVYKAAELMIRQQRKLKSQTALTWGGRPRTAGQSVTITIEKHIPISQGLGGGSSNAAATLKGLNKLLGLNLSTNELKTLAAEVGMDVPFFIEGGVALGEHFGEQITRLPPVKGLAFTLFPGARHTHPGTQPAQKPLPKKTEKAYTTLDLSLCGKNTEKTAALIHAIKTNDIPQIRKNIHNDFETLPEYAPTTTPNRTSARALPENHHLTGSGPGYFLVS